MNKIYVIKNKNGIISFFNNLEIAMNELKKIYKMTFDFKFYNYEINVFTLVENEYKFSNVTYTYKFDQFSIRN